MRRVAMVVLGFTVTSGCTKDPPDRWSHARDDYCAFLGAEVIRTDEILTSIGTGLADPADAGACERAGHELRFVAGRLSGFGEIAGVLGRTRGETQMIVAGLSPIGQAAIDVQGVQVSRCASDRAAFARDLATLQAEVKATLGEAAATCELVKGKR